MLIKNKDKNNDYNENVNKLFEITREELNKEIQRANILDNKAGLIISLVFAIVAIFVPLIPFKKMKCIYSKIGGFPFHIWIIITLLIISFIFELIGIYKLTFMMKTHDYTGINISYCFKSKLNIKNEVFNFNLAKHYKDIIINHRQINDKKAKLITQSLKIIILSMTGMIIFTILLRLILI